MTGRLVAPSSPLSSLYERNLIRPVSRSPVPVRLKSNGSLSLDGIISVFTESITEEHAWAVIYGCAKALEEVLSNSDEKEELLYCVSCPAHIIIHVDGKVHPSTFQGSRSAINTNSLQIGESPERSPMTSVDTAIAKLGEVIYHTLDYGLTDEDERQLTPGLENLLELMLSSDSEDPEAEEELRTVETDDEGIEQDHDEGSSSGQGSGVVGVVGGRVERRNGGGVVVRHKQRHHQLSSDLSSVYRVLNLCTNHLSVSKEAEHHFKNVCRALVSEALELSSFIERVQKRDSSHAKEIQELALLDWACLWKETMFQLRQGVKLKKTNYTKTPIEYELTPYEILMDDIRSRRFKLNKVMVNGDLPLKVKKDAHDIILDFIRSRPPLKPASRRVLPPKKLDVTPQELLMKSICSPSAKASLKKTPGPPLPKKSFMELYHRKDRVDGRLDESRTPFKEKKSTSSNQPKKPLHSSSSLLTLSRKNRPSQSAHLSEKSKSSGNLKRLIKPDPQFLKFDPYDDSDDDFLSSPPELRRSPATPNSSSKSYHHHEEEKSPDISPILPGARRLSYSSVYSPADPLLRAGKGESRRAFTLTSTPNVPDLGGSPSSQFLSTNHHGLLKMPNSSSKDDRLTFDNCDLSLAEMIHIRSVLTKAELEDSPLNPRIKHDLENSKLCFVCMKQYFGFFSWTYKCKLCQKSVCSSCMTKIKIPSDDKDDNISPSSLQDTPRRSILHGVAETREKRGQIRLSKSLRKSDILLEPSSLPLTPTTSDRNKVRLRRSNTLKYEREYQKRVGEGGEGSLCTVCLSCRDILLLNSHTKGSNSPRRQQVTRSLCLG